jgi:hypothetical protein
METLSSQELRWLSNNTSGPCVSLYMPTHRAGAETAQDPVRLKNLLREAEHGLLASGQRGAEITRLLSPARLLLDDYAFWQHQGDGLAILSSPELFRLYRLRFAVRELAVTSDRFHLRPLLAWMAIGGPYYVLGLSQTHVRVFQGTREGLLELQSPDLPAELTRTLKHAAERQLQCHSASPASRRSPVFHGHGGGDEDRKRSVLAYFQSVDEGMKNLLAQNHQPVVLAAVDYLNAIYRLANTSPTLMDDWVSGNPDHLAPEELHRKAESIVAARFIRDQALAADQYSQLWYTGRTANAPAEILPAAHQGRVQSLFVASGVQVWGQFDESSQETIVFDAPTTEAQDLLNLAAVRTFLSGGSVYSPALDEMPGGGPVAAVFRY